MSADLTIVSERQPWTEDQLESLMLNYADFPTFLVAHVCGHSLSSTYQKARALGLEKSAAFAKSELSGRIAPGSTRGGSTRFKPGQVPSNKGLRRPGWAPGRMATTQFKKGRPPEQARNYLPIGSVRVTRDGMLERKVTDDPAVYPARRWVAVTRLVWEEANGPIPSGHAVVFRAGRHTTVEAEITVDRLELVSRGELMRRNSYHTRYPKEVAQLIQLKGALNRKINRRSRGE